MTGYYQRQSNQQNKAPKLCWTCHKVQIVFDNNIRSQKGTPIPLDANTHEPHDCPESQYNKKQQYGSVQQQPQQPQQQPEQKQQVNYSGVEVIGGIQEVGDMMKECLTLLRALKPNDVLTKEKEELIRENSELKEAVIKLQEFKPASQIAKSEDQTESEFTT